VFFQQIVDQDLGCASYIVASSSEQTCLIVDPRWEIEPYLEVIHTQGFTVSGIVETHTHADHVSGHGRLAEATGAPIYIHESADVEYPHRSLRDGDVIRLAEVSLHVLHTPGHRPEHIALAVEDGARGADPWLVMTGDSLLVGDVARPDLAVDGIQGAELLFQSLHEKLLTLPEFTQVYPAHLAGSLCGRVDSHVSGTTLGYERRYNAALTVAEPEAFVAFMNRDLPQRPPNMERVVALNRGPLNSRADFPARLSPEDVSALDDSILRLDVRPSDDYLCLHIPGSVHVPVSGSQFGTRAGFVVAVDTELVLVSQGDDDCRAAVNGLRAVGFEKLRGFLRFEDWIESGREVASIPTISARDLSFHLGRDDVAVLDVREPSEWKQGVVEGAQLLPYHRIMDLGVPLPQAALVATVCESGVRSAIAAALLERRGLSNAANVSGGMTAWVEAGLPAVPPPDRK